MDYSLMSMLVKAVLITHFIDMVKGLGQVEAVFKTLSNPGGQLESGTCNNGRCKIKMKVSFSEPSLESYKSDYIEFQDHLTFNQSGPGALNDKGHGIKFDNPINITASGQEKLKRFGLTIELSDYSRSTRKLMAEMEHIENVTTGVIYNRTLSQGDIEMEISFKVICETNYYFDCSVHCKAQDDNLGHYTCDPVTGGKVCREGWTGEDCLIRVCPQPAVTGGSVTSPPQAFYQENDTMTVVCDEDFHLNPHLKSNVLKCEPDGQWSFPLNKVCREGGCGGCDRLREPLHGRLTYRSQNGCGNINLNSTVQVTCYPRYLALVQFPELYCGEDEVWRSGTGEVVVEGKTKLLDCLPDGDDVNGNEDTLKRQLAQSAAIISSAIMFTLLGLCCLYGILYRRRDKEKRKVSPRRKSYVPEEIRHGSRTLKCAGIGRSETLRNVPEVQKSNNSLAQKPGYYNHGFEIDIDYDF